MRISIVIPVKNGESTIYDCLRCIYAQKVSSDLDVIILDSASTDNTLAICRQFPVRIVNIKPHEFNHGLTRNYGVSIAKGELVFFTVQDARIAEVDMLARMSACFDDDDVAAVVGMQAVPNEKDKNPAVWFKRYTKPKIEVRHYPNGDFSNLAPYDQFINSAWDNVNAMYRREALLALPFKKTDFSEDWLWANSALLKGYKLLRDPSCVVYHYHHRTFSYAFRTMFIINYHNLIHFKVLPKVPCIMSNTSHSSYRIIRNLNLSIISKMYWLNHNILFEISEWLSIKIFKLSYKLGGFNLLNKAYNLICNRIPQGKLKDG